MRRRSVGLLLVVTLLVGVVGSVGAGVSSPEFITTWGQFGTADGDLDKPDSVAVAPDGTIYVADTFNHRIQAFTFDGTFITRWGEFGTGNGDLAFPRGIAVAPDGTVYVADTNNHRVQAFTPSGVFITKWGEPGTDPGEFDGPEGVAVAPDGTVYVAERGNHRIQGFTPGGTLLHGPWGGFGSENEKFNNPKGVAVAPDGTVYVADTDNSRIQAFTPAGDFITKWGEFGFGPSDLRFPEGLAVASDGTVFVANTGNHRIHAYGPSGDLITTWGNVGGSTGDFVNPADVATGLFGTVFVADHSNDRIQKFAFPSVTRAAGANRFGTAAAISKLHHPFAVDTVFVATGTNFPDALAGAVAAAVSRSPLLLAGSLPQATADELARLDPDDVVILGGEAAVGSATASQLAAFGDVTRLFGANRYLTAIEISKHAFPSALSVDALVVATGQNFPDALAAASLAARVNGPVLLTPSDVLPDAVFDEATRLSPSHIYVVGGPSAVSNAVLESLGAIAPTSRIAGTNRYITAVEISKAAFPTGAEVVYIAVGTNFPDALAGAAQAAAWGAPVLLTPTNALPQAVIDEITRLDPYAVVILGGTAVISPAVENQLRALLGL